MRNTVIVEAALIAIGTCRAERMETVFSPRTERLLIVSRIWLSYATRLYKTAGIELRSKHFCAARERHPRAPPLAPTPTIIGLE